MNLMGVWETLKSQLPLAGMVHVISKLLPFIMCVFPRLMAVAISLESSSTLSSQPFSLREDASLDVRCSALNATSTWIPLLRSTRSVDTLPRALSAQAPRLAL